MRCRMRLGLFTLLLTFGLNGHTQVGQLSQYLSFDGILTDNAGVPLTAGSYNITFGVYAPNGTCLLYEETQSVSVPASGAVSVFIGSVQGNVKRTVNDPNLAWANIFQNSSNLTGSGSCAYSVAPGDSRRLRVTVASSVLSPDYTIAATPTATVAESLQGKLPSDFLAVNGAANLNQSNLESIFNSTNFTTLTALIGGTSSLYTKADGSNFSPSAPFSVNSQKIINLVSPTNGTDAVNKTYADTNIGGKASSNLSGLGVPDSGKVLSWDGTQWTASTPSATDSTKLPLAGGTMSGALLMGGNNVHGVGAVGIGTAAPDASAALEIFSSTKGLLLPRMTSAQRDAIPTPVAGLQIYNTTMNELNYHNGTSWQTIGAAGGGISNLNGATDASQALAVGTSGLSPAWSSTTSTHTLNLPLASSAGVTAGLISKTDYDVFNSKISSNLNSGQILVGNGSNIATAVAVTGDATLNNTGILTIETGAVSTAKIIDGGITLSKLSGALNTNSLVVTGMSGLQTLSCAVGQFAQANAGVPSCSSISLPTSAGTNGQVLVGNGSGAVNWETPYWISNADTFDITGNANGLSVASGLMKMHAATATTPGGLSIGAQTIGGAKTFNNITTIGTGPANSELLLVNGFGTFRNNASGNPLGLVLENQNMSMSGIAMEFKGNDGGVPKPLARIVAKQPIPGNGELEFQISNGGSYQPAMRIAENRTVSLNRNDVGMEQFSVLGTFGDPVAKFTSDTSSTLVDVILDKYVNMSHSGPVQLFQSGRGNHLSPATTAAGDGLGKIVFRGTVTGTASGGGASIKAAADQAFSGGANGTYLSFGVTNIGTSSEIEALRISSNGSVGIGTSTPTSKLHVLGTGTVAFFTDGGASCSIMPSSAGNISCSSDERLKEDIEAVSDKNSLESILKLRTVTYKWKHEDSGRHTGYLAQEVEKIAPEFVHNNANGYKQVSYTGFIPWLTGAIKAVYQELSEFKEIQILEKQETNAKIKKLESENAALKSYLCKKDPAAPICE